MKYSHKIVENIKLDIYDKRFINRCRMNKNNFIRNRKIYPKDIIIYVCISFIHINIYFVLLKFNLEVK